MTIEAVRAVADAVLYEGYLLYPYRASAVKNRSRWQFGVLGPPAAAARAFGEPPSWMHPVVGMGRYLGLFKLSRLPPAVAFIAGALAWLVGAALVGFIALWLSGWVLLAFQPATSPLRLLAAAGLLGLLLKPLFAWRMLAEEAMAVEAALSQSLDAGRARLSRLVSRDTSALTGTEVRAAAIETLA